MELFEFGAYKIDLQLLYIVKSNLGYRAVWGGILSNLGYRTVWGGVLPNLGFTIVEPHNPLEPIDVIILKRPLQSS